MNEIRCPMCGKANPSELEVCRFCQARLKPLTDAFNKKNDDDISESESISEKSDLSDWMDEIRDAPESLEHDLSEEWNEEGLSNAHGTATDWLSRIDEKQKDVEKSIQKEKPSFTQEEPKADLSLYDEQFEELISDIPEIDEFPEHDNSENENAGETQLSPADLPTWLEAIRSDSSVEDAVQIAEAERTASVERAGPLTGLRNVLPAEPDIALSGKPTNLFSKLQVTEQQLVHVKMLQDILKLEEESGELPSKSIISSQSILRSVVFFILVLATFFPIVLDIPEVKVPVFTPEIFELSQTISDLSVTTPILMIVDYQAGYSGEMDAISGVILDHLMSKRIYLVFASTTSTGAVQAEHLIQKVNQSVDNPYETSINYVNLGLITAGPSGILAFSQNPRQIRPSSIDLDVVWDYPQLETIYDLSDFAMLIVATENPETARAWIEQAQPELDDTPLVMLTSSQAEPLIRPYLETQPGQIQGYLGGLYSAVQYQSLLRRTDIALEYWSAYSVGIIFALSVIVIWVIYFLVAKRIKRFRIGGEVKE